MAQKTKKPKSPEVTLDRRSPKDRRQSPKAAPAPRSERRKVSRRRQIDPTTCERDYSQDEIEFMQAMDAYKRSSGRMFPTCSEILEVVRALGYTRPEQESPAVPVIDTLTTPATTPAAAAHHLDDSFEDDWD